MMHSYVPRAVALGILATVVLFGFSNDVEAASNKSAQMTAAAIITETNKARAAEGLAPLTTNSLLSLSAQSKADDMLEREYFGHTTPDGERFFASIDDTGYEYMHAGENLGSGFKTAKKLVAAWLKSPAHRANLLDADYKEIGIGLVYGTINGKTGWYVVQHFGSTTY